MLNHVRPRQTIWEYKPEEDAFVITALIKLYKGDQVFDSYGRKDNRRLFFCYGFVEDDNLDGNECSPNTVAVAILPRYLDELDGRTTGKECVRSSSEYHELDPDEDCGFFFNRLVLSVVEDSEVQPTETTHPALTDGSFGSFLHERSQWICDHSPVFVNNLVTMRDDLFYDHSRSRYAFLSMCHDDAGTTTISGIISLSLI
jgi:singapore isolate B (sub-type 7) whole genome shotgun sequence assembly, scaffold_8